LSLAAIYRKLDKKVGGYLPYGAPVQKKKKPKPETAAIQRRLAQPARSNAFSALVKQQRPKVQKPQSVQTSREIANARRRLESVGVKPKVQVHKPGFLEKTLDILDRPGAFVRGILGNRNAGKSWSQSLAAGKQGFKKGMYSPNTVSSEQLFSQAVKRQNPLAVRLNKSKAGKVVGNLVMGIGTDPTVFMGVGKAPVQMSARSISKNIAKEIYRETGKKITRQSAEMLARNAQAGKMPVGRIGAAVTRAMGGQAETSQVVSSGLRQVDRAGLIAEKRAQAREASRTLAEARASREAIQNQTNTVRDILTKAAERARASAGNIPRLTVSTARKAVEAPIGAQMARERKIRATAKGAIPRLKEQIKLTKQHQKDLSAGTEDLYNKIRQQGGIKFDSEIYAGLDKEEINRIIPAGLRGSKYSMSIDEMAQALGYKYADDLVQDLRAISLRRQQGRKLPYQGKIGKLESAVEKLTNRSKGIRVIKATDPWEEDQIIKLGPTVSRQDIAEKAKKISSTANVQMNQARIRAAEKAKNPFLQVVKGVGAKLDDAKHAEKQLAEKAKLARAEAKTAARTKVEPKVSTTVETFVSKPLGQQAKDVLKVAGIPVLNVTPIKTALGATIKRVPGMTQIQDALGRIHVFNYTPTAIKGIERSKVEAGKRAVAAAGKKAPAVAHRAIDETLKGWKGISKQAAEEAPHIIEETLQGTREGRGAARKAHELFEKDVKLFAEKRIPLNVLDNYVMHMYEDAPEKVAEVLRKWRQSSVHVKGAKPGFTKERMVPTLEEAERLGLTPVKDVRVLTSVHRALSEQAAVFQDMGKELLKIGAAVRPERAPAGWVKMGDEVPMLRGTMVHPEVAQTLRNLFPVVSNSDEGWKLAGRMFGSALSGWKSVVLATPGFHVRNFVGNVWLNMADGMLNPARYSQAAAVLNRWVGHVEINGRKVPTNVVNKWFEDLGLKGQGMFSEVAGQQKLTDEARKAIEALDSAGFSNVKYFLKNPVKGVLKGSHQFGENVDSLSRMTSFLHHLDRGLSPKDAAAAVRKALFDYGELTATEQKIRKYAVPFYTWRRKALPRVAERLIGAPGAFTGPAHLREAFVNINNIDEEHLPDWIRENQAMPYKVDGEGNIYYITWNLPFTELSAIHDPQEIQEWGKEALSMVNPFATSLAQVATNTNALTGRKITDTPDLDAQAAADYGRFLLRQFAGIPGRELAGSMESRERAAYNAVQAQKGKVDEWADTPKTKFGLPYTVQNEQNWKLADLSKEKSILSQTIRSKERQGVKVPTIKELDKKDYDNKVANNPFYSLMPKSKVTGDQKSDNPFSSIIKSGSGADTDAVVAEALNYLGTPYRWGGSNPATGLDCSGFTQLVFKNMGVNIPRTSKQQSRVGQSISPSQMQPGDLVFFGRPVHHVGIYMGEGRYIHSPKRGDVVKVSDLKRRRDFVGARRVF